MATGVKRKRKRRPWPSVAVMLALLGQVIGYGLLIYVHLLISEHVVGSTITGQEAVWVIVGFVAHTAALVVIPVAALFAIYTILRRWRTAWAWAITVQTFSLALSLALYARSRPFYTYLIMVYAVVMVFYLMLPATQAAFVPPGGE